MQVLFGSSFYQRRKSALFGASSLLQFSYPAFNCAYNFTLTLPARPFLMGGLQVLQFSSSAFYYFHNRIHDTLTTPISNCLAALCDGCQHVESSA